MNGALLVALILVLGLASIACLIVALGLSRRYPPLGTFVTVDGVRLHLVDRPPRRADAGPTIPIVFIHGASGNLRDLLLPFGERLRSHRLIFIDRPGHGHSQRGTGAADPKRQADLIAGALDRLGIGRAVIVGHSLGSAIAVAFGLGHPGRTAGLVFVAPATHPWGGALPWHHHLMRLPVIGWIFAHVLALPLGVALMRRFVASTFAPDPVPDNYAGRIGASLALRPRTFTHNSRDITKLHRHVTAMSPHYGAITAPTAIITGDSDPIVYAHIHAEGLARDIPGSRLTILEGVGHMPHHAATEEVLAAIKDVVSRVAETAGQAGPATISTQKT